MTVIIKIILMQIANNVWTFGGVNNAFAQLLFSIVKNESLDKVYQKFTK